MKGSTSVPSRGALDSRRFDVRPVYIAQDGRWFTGDALRERPFYQSLPGSLDQVQHVTQQPDPTAPGLTVLEPPAAGGLLRRKKETAPRVLPVDLYLPALHGSFGEDGCIQGLFEMANVAYLGCGVLPAAMCMDKALSKQLLKAVGIPVLPGISIERDSWRKDPDKAREQVLATDGLDAFPLFIKPVRQGSSYGIAPAANPAELDAALAGAFKYDTEALVEPQITDIFEITALSTVWDIYPDVESAVAALS